MCTAAWQARSAAHSAMVASFGAPPFLHTRCSQRGRSVLLHLPPLAGLHRQGVHLLCQVIYNRRVCQFWTAADCSWVWATRTASCSTGCLCKRRLLHVLLSTCLPYLRDTFFGPSAHTLNRPPPPAPPPLTCAAVCKATVPRHLDTLPLCTQAAGPPVTPSCWPKPRPRQRRRQPPRQRRRQQRRQPRPRQGSRTALPLQQWMWTVRRPLVQQSSQSLVRPLLPPPV